ncbi:MAG: patatin-like phospholipase family protein [Dysgonomonas sp.]
MKTARKYPLGVALSGGGAKGFAHLGVLQALEEAGLKPDVMSGTSAGALAGVLYADGHSPKDIASFFSNKDFRDFAAFSIPHAGIFKIDKLNHFLKKHLKARNFNELKIPFRIVATDIENGVSTTFSSGELIPAVIASCSYPIVFSPMEINGVHYSDGGLFKNFPVSVIRGECEKVIGVNVSPLTVQKYKNSLLYIIERSFHYMSISNTLLDRELCDILIESTKVSKFSMFSLDHVQEIYDIGYKTAKKILVKKMETLEK